MKPFSQFLKRCNCMAVLTICLALTGSLLFASPARAVGAAQTTDSLSGWFLVVWGDGEDGAASVTQYFLATDEQGTIRLLLEDEVAAMAGGALALNRQWITVEGQWNVYAAGGQPGFQVTAIAADLTALGNVSPAVSGSQPWVSILCKFSDIPAEPKNLAYFQNMYAGSYPGLDHYWRELSYNTVNVAGSTATGWYVLPLPRSSYFWSDGSFNLNKAASDCTQAADASVNFNEFAGINLMFNYELDGYAWGGGIYLTLDGVTKIWRVAWAPPWAYNNIMVIAHEMGHGFGWPHSSGNYGQIYDNQWDVMSDGWANCSNSTHPTYGCLGQHTISYHKDLAGWIPAGQKFQIAHGSAVITLEQLALPQSGNYLMAQIPIAGSATRFYTVEVRRKTGYDVKLPGQAVIIHEVDTTRSTPARVIDIDGNGNTGDAGAMWTVGETFRDAARGISVEIQAATATGFQVAIVTPPPPCYSLTLTSYPAAGGSIDASPPPDCGAKYSAGAIVTLTANANPAYAFLSWTGGAAGTGNPVNVTMNADKSVAANFTPCYSLTTGVTGSGSVNVATAPNCAGGLYRSGAAVTLTAAADPGNYFAHWSGSLTGSVNPSTVLMTANKNITANFLPCYPLNVTVSPGGAGTVTAVPAPNCAGGLYKTGTLVTLTAAANPAHAFDQWSGDLSGATNPRTVTMDAAKSITAGYLRCWSVTKSVSPALSGSYTITPAPNCAGGLWKDGTNLTLAAAPAAGNHFLRWSGDWSGTVSPTGFPIDANKVITAEFVTMPGMPILLAPAANALVTVYTPAFDWSDSTPNLDHYEWQIAADAAFTNILQQELNLTASNFTPSIPLPSNHTLYWRVRAVDANGFSRGWTAARLLRTALPPPNLIAPPNDANLLYPRPTFVWESVDGATGYTIQISRNDAFTLLVLNVNTVGGTNAQYTPPVNLPPNQTLFWRVRANGLRGPSAWSETRAFRSPNPPSTPLLLAPPANALTPNYYPTFDWGPATVPPGTAFDCYRLQVDDHADFSSPRLNVCVGGVDNHLYQTADPHSLAPNTLYYWRVQACNTDSECSAWSPARTLRAALEPPILNAPAEADLVPSLRPSLDWEDVTGATGYSIQVSRNNLFTLLVLNVNTVGGTNSQYTPPVNLPFNQTLFWRVRANGLNGPSAWSAVRSFTTPNPPGVPVPLTPAFNSLQTDLTPLLTWSKPLNPVTPGSAPFDHYQVQVAADAAFTAVIRDANVDDYHTPQWEATPDLNPNATYYWRVRAWNTLGHYSAWSTTYAFRTAIAAPALTYPGDAAVVNLLRPPFDWADVAGASSYTIQVSRNDAFTLLALNVTVIPSAYTPPVNLPANTPLYWRVRANGLNGPSLWSPVWSFTLAP